MVMIQKCELNVSHVLFFKRTKMIPAPCSIMCTDGENMWPSNFGLIFCCKNLKTAVPGNRFHQKEHKQLVILIVCLCMNQDWSVIIGLPSLHAKAYDNTQIAEKKNQMFAPRNIAEFQLAQSYCYGHSLSFYVKERWLMNLLFTLM